ncbi:unnamed protein product, partial [Mesorhabditis belari]|uniref:Transmembrane protein n=1 Tax=Mesorhabditis belari TaxID=2138241 RepID=A0AAF3J9N6_9BILA
MDKEKTVIDILDTDQPPAQYSKKTPPAKPQRAQPTGANGISAGIDATTHVHTGHAGNDVALCCFGAVIGACVESCMASCPCTTGRSKLIFVLVTLGIVLLCFAFVGLILLVDGG